MDFTEINSRGKRGELLGRIDRQNSRFRTAKTIIIKFGLHASFVELESAKKAVNEVFNKGRKPHWERAMNALKRCRLGHTSQETEEKPFAWIKKKDVVTKEFSEDFTLHRELEKRLPRFPGTTALKLQLHNVQNIGIDDK
ncbi:WD_REPEATS_REGION domain-containing protein [Trichonephila clavipes]|nr:WD_REPEATS_REGION domain-containing protein [Trichonephila clavipes]